jgi:hypothetical protein
MSAAERMRRLRHRRKLGGGQKARSLPMLSPCASTTSTLTQLFTRAQRRRQTMNQHQEYDDQQQQLARELGHKLDGIVGICRPVMNDHAIATSMIGIGVQTALRTMEPAEVAEWLQGIADEIMKPEAGTVGRA